MQSSHGLSSEYLQILKTTNTKSFGLTKKNVQVILNAINSSASASYVVAEYERFISFEKMNYSFMAKYFISDKCKTDKFQYEFAAKEYSLYRFCEFYTLFVYCQEYSIKEYPVNQEKIIQLTSQYISNTVSDYLTDYYYKSKSSTIRPYDMEKCLQLTYLSQSFISKNYLLTVLSVLLLIIVYIIEMKRMQKKLQNFWRDNNLTREEKEGYYVDDSFQGINSYMI